MKTNIFLEHLILTELEATSPILMRKKSSWGFNSLFGLSTNFACTDWTHHKICKYRSVIHVVDRVLHLLHTWNLILVAFALIIMHDYVGNWSPAAMPIDVAKNSFPKYSFAMYLSVQFNTQTVVPERLARGGKASFDPQGQVRFCLF